MAAVSKDCQGHRWNKNRCYSQSTAIQVCLSPQETLLPCHQTSLSSWSSQGSIPAQLPLCLTMLALGASSCSSERARVSKALEGLGKSCLDEDLLFLNLRNDRKPHSWSRPLVRGVEGLWLSRICILQSAAPSDAGSSSYPDEPYKSIV